jgi:hypothetical protein
MENLIELSLEEKIEIEGGILPIICWWAVAKGIGIGFAAAAAVYGAYELGHSIGHK